MPDLSEVLSSPKFLIGLAVFVVIVVSLDWLNSHPAVLVLVLAAIAGSVFLWMRHTRARNRV